MLAGPAGPVSHVVSLVFDNVHISRDNTNVQSDLEQMPHLLSLLEQNGALLSNEHTPLIAHTADDILTTLTGVYGDKHGQPVANSYRTFSTNGTSSSSSSFAYWTDPVTNSSATDQTFPRIRETGLLQQAAERRRRRVRPGDAGGVDDGAVEHIYNHVHEHRE